ncbi:hypothetical protein V5R04_11960 [Jonesiaceae bacterium BS-20]|uniref:Uncharacterized protein n=1 Tax=Jonesiaceae bacterium BS-20 TaxID=3120821 RepID=A0AAU7DV81_9MICO
MTQVISGIAVAALLIGATPSCESDDSKAQSSPSESQEEARTPEPNSEDTEPAVWNGEGEDPATMEDSPGWNGEGEDPATMEDSPGWNGEGEDPATMEDSDQGASANAGNSTYATLPGDCVNDVPLPDSQHAVLSQENLGGGECLIVIDSRGDSLFMANDIKGQLVTLGFRQTSAAPDDQGDDAMNVFSYLTGTHEVHVTVQQDGISGVIITYALTKKLRGNG